MFLSHVPLLTGGFRTSHFYLRLSELAASPFWLKPGTKELLFETSEVQFQIFTHAYTFIYFPPVSVCNSWFFFSLQQCLIVLSLFFSNIAGLSSFTVMVLPNPTNFAVQRAVFIFVLFLLGWKLSCIKDRELRHREYKDVLVWPNTEICKIELVYPCFYTCFILFREEK